VSNRRINDEVLNAKLGGDEVAEGPTREETEQRLEAIFSSALDGKALEKMISSIPTRMEKFEGKWDGLIGWAEKKYGSPQEEAPEEAEEPEEAPEEAEVTEPEGKKKRQGLFSRMRKPKKEKPEVSADDSEAPADEPPFESEQGPTREETEQRLEAIFSSALDGKALEKMISSIPTRMEKFEGKWDGLIGWAEKKYGSPQEEAPEEAEGDSGAEVDPEGLTWGNPEGDSGDIDISSEDAFSEIKSKMADEGSNPEIWRELAAYFESVGKNGRSRACEEKAEALS